MADLQIVDVNPQVQPEFVDIPNPLLDDPAIRFAEETFVRHEREFGEEGDVAGFLNCIERWRKANQFALQNPNLD